ncbi:hypothetical protein H4R33_005211 [Dimargaris cristalligena]|nr:hypothetical protein H4R33_005211 [Dimargaris cristalligena]
MSEVQAEIPVAAPVTSTKAADRDSVIADEGVTQTAVETPAEPAVEAKVAEPIAEVAVEAPATEAVVEAVTPADTEANTTKAVVETPEVAPAAEAEAAEEVIEPIVSGYLSQRGPRPLRLWNKRYFALRSEPYALTDLHLVYKKNINRGSKIIRAAAAGKAAESDNDDLFTNIASATVSSKGLLYYYKSEKETNAPLGIINLRHVAEGSPAVEKNARAHAFSLKTTGREYVLAAASDKELKSWLQTIQQEAAAEHESLAENESFKATLDQLTQNKAFGKVSAPVTPAVETPKAVLSDTEVFSGSEAEAEATDAAETPASEVADGATPQADRRRSYFATFDRFIKNLRGDHEKPTEAVPAAEEERAAEATEAETPAVEATTEPTAEPAAGEAVAEAEVSAIEAEAAAPTETTETSPVHPTATEQAKLKAKELGTFISKFFPKRAHEEATAEAKDDTCAVESTEATEAVPQTEETVPTEAAVATPEAEVVAETATATEEAVVAPESPARAASPIQRTLTKLLRPLHFTKSQPEAATAATEEAVTTAPVEATAEEAPKAEEAAVPAEGAETTEGEAAPAAESTEAEAAKPANKPTSFLKRFGTFRASRAAASPKEAETAEATPTEAGETAQEAEAPEAAAIEEVAAPEVTTLKSGFLHKQSQFVKGYDRRFVALTDSGKVTYGKSDKDVKGHKSLNVTKATGVVKIDEGKRPFTFDIVTAARTYRFAADSDEERTSWIEALANYQATLPEPEPKEEEVVEPAVVAEENVTSAPVLPVPVLPEDLTPAAESTEAAGAVIADAVAAPAEAAVVESTPVVATPVETAVVAAEPTAPKTEA